MKKFFLSVLWIAGLLSAATAQKKIHDENAEVRAVSNFHSIKVSGGIDLYLSEGEEAVAVSAAEARHRDQIRVGVENGVLSISYDAVKQVLKTGDLNLKAYVSYRQLQSLQASAGSDIKVHGAIRGDQLKLTITSGSDFDGRVEVKELVVEQHAGSDIEISGTATSLIINATSGSDFDGYELNAEVGKVEAKSGSDVSVSVSKELFIDAGVSSDVHYKGKPVVTDNRRQNSTSGRKKSSYN